MASEADNNNFPHSSLVPSTSQLAVGAHSYASPASTPSYRRSSDFSSLQNGSPSRTPSYFRSNDSGGLQHGIKSYSGDFQPLFSPLSMRIGSGMDGLTPSAAGLSARQADAYVSELLSYSLERLRKEPELLSEEQERVERGSQAAALSNYRTFINVADMLSTVEGELKAVAGSLEALLEETPKLAAACEGFAKDATSVMEQHTQNKTLMSNQGTVLEVVEVAQLMDTCVRNGIFDEALDLQAFVTRFALLHPQLRVVQLLLQEVNSVAGLMMQQLLSKLRGPLSLPECLRVMGHLRRMSTFSEQQLRLYFLGCREAWLGGLEAELDTASPYEYLKQLSDLHRLHLFDIVMQYKAVFFDGPSLMPGQEAAVAASTGSSADSRALFSWVHYRVGHYVQRLEEHLPRVTDAGSLASILENCMYCGSSLSRVGMDFTSLLLPCVERLALQLFAANLAGAVDAFQTRLEGHKWVSIPSFSSRVSRAAQGTDGGSPKRSAGDGAGKGGEAELAPPYMLMEHPPLALFVNNVLMAFNELRHYALLPLCHPLARLLQQALEQAITCMVHYQHTHTLPEADTALFRSTARALCDVATPYLISCFAHIFPGGAGKVDVASSAVLLKQGLGTTQ